MTLVTKPLLTFRVLLKWYTFKVKPHETWFTYYGVFCVITDRFCTASIGFNNIHDSTPCIRNEVFLYACEAYIFVKAHTLRPNFHIKLSPTSFSSSSSLRWKGRCSNMSCRILCIQNSVFWLECHFVSQLYQVYYGYTIRSHASTNIYNYIVTSYNYKSRYMHT